MTTKDKARSTEEALRVERALKLELQRIRSIVGQVTGLDDEDEDNLRDAYKSIDRVIDSLAESRSDVKPWAGLTDEERNAIGRHHAYVDNIIRATEAKLKEKNDF